MLAVFVNCGAVILGSIIGLLFAKKFTEELSDMIQTACGVITLVLGTQMAFKYNNIVLPCSFFDFRCNCWLCFGH